MKCQMPAKRRVVASIENTSVMRKFTILFLLMSVIPMAVLYYLYIQIRDNGALRMTVRDLNLTLIFVVLGILVGYLAMRALLGKFIRLTHSSRAALKNYLPADSISDLNTESNELAVLAKSFSQITNRLEENIRSLETAQRTLHSVLQKVGQGISNMQNIDAFLDLIIETVTGALNGEKGMLWMADDRGQEVSLKTVYGNGRDAGKDTRLKISESAVLRSIFKTRQPLTIAVSAAGTLHGEAEQYFFQAPGVYAPLITHDQVKGILAVTGSFTDDEMNLLFNVAQQTAVAVENSKLNEDRERTYFETISALALAVDAKDTYSRGHLDRVAQYCVQIAVKLGLDETEIATLRDAARLHDLGKIGIPDDVLRKEGQLSSEEWLLMRRHPEIGEGIIKPIHSLSHLCDIIRHHHEKLDGTGYPDGLRGDEIAPLVRITTVADIYDALTTDRPYRKRFTKEEACRELKRMRDAVDQDVVDAFIETL